MATDTDLLRALMDTSGSVIVGLRPDHTIFAWNRAAELLYGMPRADALGRDYVATFLVPEHRDAVAADIRAVLLGKATWDFEDDSLLSDGRRRTLAWNVTRVLDPAGQPSGILAIGHDITERKLADERFRLLFEHADEGLLLADHTGVIDANPAAVRLLGLADKADLLGRRPAEFSPPLQPDGVPSDEKSRQLGARTAVEGQLSFEWMHRRPDGTDVPVLVSVRHAMLNGERLSVVLWHDLTRQRELERTRLEVQQRLDQAHKMEAIGQLAGGVAHDFNNLLAAARNAVELAAEGLAPGSAAQDDLGLALDALQRATGLTRQLLAFSRRQPTRLEVVDLGDLARDVMPLLVSSLPPTVQATLDIAPGPLPVRADSSQLEQVLLNLVLNARDAMPDGGHLQVQVAPEGASICLEVRDSGHGMPDEVRHRIFEPFFTTKPVGQGTGLGLSVVYGVVTEAGGTIGCESAPGEGTTFRITLPRCERRTNREVTATVEALGGGRLALLVDDELAVRRTTRRLLERLDWRVVEAENGEAGWATFLRHRHDIALVFTDVRMPELDGIRLSQRIRSESAALPIILCSGYYHADEPAQQLVPGVRQLAKPFDLRQLSDALRFAAGAAPA